MSKRENKQWSKRYSWADCSEPYKNELDTLGSHWIEGELSNAELALEAIRLLSDIDTVGMHVEGLPDVKLDDVRSQLRILMESIVISELNVDQTQDDRKASLDFVRKQFNKDQGLTR